MKKYFFLTITVLAVIVSSFALIPEKRETPEKQTSLYWFVGSSYTGRQNTKVNEIPFSGCPDTGTVHCEDGYDGNDFNVLNDPTSGLKMGATINDFIRKQ